MQSLCVVIALRVALSLLLALGLASAVAAQPVREAATVVRVIDGDTVEVRAGGQVERVRLIGLNTPETVDPRRPVECFGREASAQAKKVLSRGLRVELEADPTQGNHDRYVRLLRYIWLPDGRNFAEVMIGEGYGFEYTYRLPYRYQDRFRDTQRQAREQGRGLWAPNACAGGRGGVRADSPPPALPRPGPSASPPGVNALLPEVLAARPCRPGQIKGNRNSRIYHPPTDQHYARTYANVQCFDTEADAAAAGFRRARH